MVIPFPKPAGKAAELGGYRPHSISNKLSNTRKPQNNTNLRAGEARTEEIVAALAKQILRDYVSGDGATVLTKRNIHRVPAVHDELRRALGKYLVFLSADYFADSVCISIKLAPGTENRSCGYSRLSRSGSRRR